MRRDANARTTLVNRRVVVELTETKDYGPKGGRRRRAYTPAECLFFLPSEADLAKNRRTNLYKDKRLFKEGRQKVKDHRKELMETRLRNARKRPMSQRQRIAAEHRFEAQAAAQRRIQQAQQGAARDRASGAGAAGAGGQQRSARPPSADVDGEDAGGRQRGSVAGSSKAAAPSRRKTAAASGQQGAGSASAGAARPKRRAAADAQRSGAYAGADSGDDSSDASNDALEESASEADSPEPRARKRPKTAAAGREHGEGSTRADAGGPQRPVSYTHLTLPTTPYV